MAATPCGPALVLRPWGPEHAPGLARLHRDDGLRHATSAGIEDEASARRWIADQRRAWETGSRFGFAVTETEAHMPGDGGQLVGHVVLKRKPEAGSAEVGYWTAVHARGRGVAPRALEGLTDWALRGFAAAGLVRLELLHQVDNTASCRVAGKCRYELAGLVPAAPPDFPLDGHLHVRESPR